MSLVFSTVLIFLIFSPGIVFRVNYYRSDFSKRNANISLIDDVLWSSIPAILFHVFGLFIAYKITGYTVNFEFIGNLIIVPNNQTPINEIFTNISQNIKPIVLYTIWINLIAIPIGNLSREFIRYRSFDIKHRAFRFPNKWYYLLKGEALQFPHLLNNLKIKYLLAYVNVDVLVKENGSEVTYLRLIIVAI